MSPPLSSRSGRVPQEILTDALVEDIKTRYCFVGTALEINRDSMRSSSPAPASESDFPPSSDAAMSESEFSRASEGVESISSSQHTSSEFEVISQQSGSGGREGHLQMLANMYTRHSTATDIQLRVVPPTSQQLGTGRGTLIIPGWIRERAAEVLFEGGDVDENSVAEVLLETLLKVISLPPASSYIYPVLNVEPHRYPLTSGKRSCPPFSSRAAQRCYQALSHGFTPNCCVPSGRRCRDHARDRRGREDHFHLRTIAMRHFARSSLTLRSSTIPHHSCPRRHRARLRTRARHLHLHLR